MLQELQPKIFILFNSQILTTYFNIDWFFSGCSFVMHTCVTCERQRKQN